MRIARYRTWWGILLVVVALLVALVWVVPKLVDLNRYQDSLESMAGDALGGQVQLGALRWGIGAGIWLEAQSVSIAGTRWLALELETANVDVRIALRPLLQRQLVFSEIRIHGAKIKLQLQDPPALEPSVVSPAPESAGGGFTVAVASLHIDDATLRLQDRRTGTSPLPELNLADLDIAVDGLGGGGAETGFDIALSLQSPQAQPWGKLAAKGTLQGLAADFSLLQPQLQLTAELGSLSTAALQSWLADQTIVDRLGGSLSAHLTYAGWPGDAGKAHGAVDLSQFSYEDSALWPEPIPGMSGKLQFAVELEQHALKVQQLDLSLGDIEVAAQTTIRNFRDQPLLSDTAISATLPLTAALPLVPWHALGHEAEQIRDLMAAGGLVHIEKVELPRIDLQQPSPDFPALLKQAKASVQLSELSLQAAPRLPRLKHIEGQLQLADGVLEGRRISAKIGPLSLPNIALSAVDLLDNPKFKVAASGPMRLSASSSEDIKALLAPYDLAAVSGAAHVDLELDYDMARPSHYQAKGSFQLQNFELTTLRHGNRLRLLGGIELHHRDTLELKLDALRGQINQTPVSVEGSVHDAGGEQFGLDLKARTNGLELSLLADFVPQLEAMGIAGSLDADVAVQYQSATPEKTRLKGSIAGRQLQLQVGDYRIRQGNASLALTDDKISIRELALLLNDQALTANGYLRQQQTLSGKIHLTSPQLNLDRLLPEKPAATQVLDEEQGGRPIGTSSELPAFARSALVDFSAAIAAGQYREQHFKDLQLQFALSKGIVNPYRFSVAIADGKVAARGSLDLNDLSRIPFDIDYQIESIQLERITPLLTDKPTELSGPFNGKGHFSGHSGSEQEILQSLRGQFNVSAGPGKIPQGGVVGKSLFSVLEFINLKGILSGEMASNLAQRGVPFTSFQLQSQFTEERVNLEQVDLNTPAFHTTGQGQLNLVERTIELDMDLTVLGTIDRVLGLVPLVGSAASSVTKAYLRLSGPLDKPSVKLRQTRGMIKALSGEVRNPVEQAGKGWNLFKDRIMKSGDESK